MSKYRSTRTLYAGIWFDSKAEAHRYFELICLQQAQKIMGLNRQTKFVLIPKNKNGREISYRSDFYYFDLDTGKWVIEDVKGFRTPVYKLKKRMMAEKGYFITEVK